MDKRGFGYDGFSDKITTHGRSHLSILRESYRKNDLKRKITDVNLKVSFTVGFCLFFFSGFCLFCFLSNLVGRQLFFFILCYLLLLCLPPISSLCLFAFLSSTLLYVPLTSFFFHLYLFMFHLHQNIKKRIIHSCLLYLVLQWILGFLLLYLYPF